MIWLLVLGLVLCFGLVLLVGAPYLPTLRRQRHVALELLNLKPGQQLYELGCGDGTLMIEAARRGLYVTGYELNPVLFAVAWLRSLPWRSKVRVVWGNFWQADLSGADGVYVFLHSRFMHRLDTKLKNEVTRSCVVASYGFAIPGRKATVRQAGIFLYHYKPLAARS